MRSSELLNALSCYDPGIEVFLNSKQATINTLYEPGACVTKETLFDAALELGKLMIAHPDCPKDVRAALEAYDLHSYFLAL